jgi:hypothetical protein
MCESFNKWIIEARFFPIITMLETIRRKVMVRIHDNRLKSDRWLTKICPNILNKMNTYITHSGKCHAICNGAAQFEVMHFDNRFTVDLYNKVCSCRYWQLSGLPCPHAISCIFFKTNCLDDYIAPCYSTESFKKTYAHCLQPVEGMTSWPVSDREKLKAPGYVRMPGRPKTERRREATEPPKGSRMSKVGTVIRCTKCKQTGHNRTSCDKRNAASAGNPTAGSQAAGSQAAWSQVAGSQAAGAPHEMVVVSNTQSSCTTSKKRNPSTHTKNAAKVTTQLTILH